MDKSDVTEHQMWFVLLGCIGFVVAILSMIPNYVIVIILCKNDITSDALVNFRSCACADILCATLFLIFVCPSWLRDAASFSTATCSVVGVVNQWAGLVLHYSLVYLIFQRYSESRKSIGWKESKTCFMPRIIIIWVIFGVIAAVPFAHSLSAYSYNPDFYHCVLHNPSILLCYDAMQYLLPSLLLFTAGTLLKSLQSKPMKRIKTSRRCSSYFWPRHLPEGRNSLTQLSRRYIQMEPLSNQYYSTLQQKRDSKGLMVSSIENHLMGLETRLTFIYIAYTSSSLILVSFIFRIYGTWTVPLCREALFASHIFTFAAGITRSVIPLVVSKAATEHMSRRSGNPMTAKNSAPPRPKKRVQKRKRRHAPFSGFLSFSLFMMSSKGGARTHNNDNHEMESFWFNSSKDKSKSLTSIPKYTDKSGFSPHSKQRKEGGFPLEKIFQKREGIKILNRKSFCRRSNVNKTKQGAFFNRQSKAQSKEMKAERGNTIKHLDLTRGTSEGTTGMKPVYLNCKPDPCPININPRGGTDAVVTSMCKNRRIIHVEDQLSAKSYCSYNEHQERDCDGLELPHLRRVICLVKE